MYTEHQRFNGLHFIQQMDTETDTAIYSDVHLKVLMKVDSGGRAFDSNGEHCGDFCMNYKDSTWRYESVDGQIIQTNCKHLFDDAEPYVIGQLFGGQQ